MRISFLALLVLTACNGPVLSMRDATRAQISIGEMDFNVFHNGLRAEAHRTSRMFKPKAKVVFAAAREAIISASQCEVDDSSWAGDVAVIKVDLIC